MKDFPENNEEQTPLVSVIKEFAWYLKETAKKHDTEISDIRRDVQIKTERIIILEQQIKVCIEKIDELSRLVVMKIDNLQTTQGAEKINFETFKTRVETKSSMISAITSVIVTIVVSVIVYLITKSV